VSWPRGAGWVERALGGRAAARRGPGRSCRGATAAWACPPRSGSWLPPCPEPRGHRRRRLRPPSRRSARRR